MRLLRAMMLAFSMYSRIPMPQPEWKDEDMRYMLCFFPWVGAVIGVCIFLWRVFCVRMGVGSLCDTLFGASIPLWITGGFHVDGFMDTMDALHSYQPREKKLEILKDAHIGAFAVIMLAAYGLLYVGAFSEIQDSRLLQIVCAGFTLSRVLSGIAVVTFPSAKSEGLLYQFADSADRRIVKAALYAQGFLCIAFMLFKSLCGGMLVVLAAMLAFVSYYDKSKKALGGITGDTAGYFVVLCECSMLLAAAACDIMGG